MVDVVLQHMEAELTAFDLDKLTATLIPEPIYHTWGGRFARDEVMIVRGGDTRVEIDRFLVDDAGVYFDGEMRTVWPGAILQSFGSTPTGSTSRRSGPAS